ncbi:hypothetical protein HDR59_00705, partial [bacterium]|nr:hypothetical protein [bacterium]
EYENRLSMNLNSYLALYPQPLFVRDVNILRQNGITPEKAEYLARYFADIPIPENKSDKKILDTALSQAETHMKDILPYRVGIPVGKMGIGLGGPNLLLKKTAYKSIFKIFELKDCIPMLSNLKFRKYTDSYPKALRPTGILGTSVLNMFGEVMAEIKNSDAPQQIPMKFINDGNKPIYIYDTNIKVGNWDSNSCHISNLVYDFKESKSCISCHVFEITFNTVSRIGYVIYDKLAYYSISLMAVLFVFWMLFFFFDNVIKKQDGMAFIKTFFQKLLWVFIIGFALTVPVSDEYNVLNYTMGSLTDFMTDYNKVLTKGIESNEHPFVCKYKSKDISDSKVIFTREVRENIVCTIERISAFNNMNFDIGKYNLTTGFNQLINLNFSGFVKMIIGFCIMAIFFYVNIMVPFYFVEAFFMIATVLFVFPLILVGYALDKKQFVKQSFDTFLSAIFQVISLTLICSVISILMLYISGIDFYSLSEAIENDDVKEITSQTLYMISFSTNGLLEVFYTGFLCWFLLGEALTIANKYSSMVPSGNVANTFINWTKTIVAHTTQITREVVNLKFESSVLADKISKNTQDGIERVKNLLSERDKDNQQKKEDNDAK